MDQQTIISEFEARARAVGKPMSDICASAGVHPTTFSRWKRTEKNPEPVGATLASLSRIDAALTAAESVLSNDRDAA
ncbi:hypothetical protein [Phenylobacterium sp.]|uniref:hypothetical protein n=1 Tax=Phenylobacterium sp. TaxID=1871053 RepID=UPI003935443E